MSAVQQMLLSSGVYITLPDDDFLFGQADASRVANIDPAVAIATISINIDGSLELVFTAEEPVSDLPAPKQDRWFPTGDPGSVGVYSARFRRLVGGFNGIGSKTFGVWYPITEDLNWSISAIARDPFFPAYSEFKGVLEIAYTTQTEPKTIIANTNVDIIVSASVSQS